MWASLPYIIIHLLLEAWARVLAAGHQAGVTLSLRTGQYDTTSAF